MKPYNVDSTADDRDEVANFFFDLGVGGDRLCDLFPKQSAEALTQSVNGNVNGAWTDAPFGGQVRPRGIAAATGEETLKRLKELALAGCGVFVPQFRHRPLEHGKRPAPIKHRLGCPLVGRFKRVTSFRVRTGQRHERLAAAPALGACPLAFVGEKVFQAREKEGTKLPSVGLHAPEGVSFEETKEELLREVLGLMRAGALSPDEGIERIPIGRA